MAPVPGGGMPVLRLLLLSSALLLGVTEATTAVAQTCNAHPIALQVLGSGGPFPSASASTAYVVWLNGQSAILVDAGGGSFLRFGESGARVDQLELIAISHLHPDHVSDLPAILWLTGTRSSPLPIVGPSGNDLFPDFSVFLSHLLGNRDSAFPILSQRANRGQGGAVTLRPMTIDAAKPEPTSIPTDAAFKISALGVPHTAPSLAYRISVGDLDIVFSSDQTGSNPRFVDFARGANILVMHFTLSLNAQGPITQNHATPAVVGEIAARAQVGHLVLSHLSQPRADEPGAAMFSAYSSATLEASVAEVRKQYAGLVTIASDLQCIALRQ